jgi:hypothetical protein
MSRGPVQLLVLAFEGGEFKGAVRSELERLVEADTIRVLDAVFVAKDADGSVRTLEAGDHDGRMLLRLLDGSDAGAEAQLEDAAAAIPPGTASALLVIEHRWAVPLRDAVASVGGQTVAQTWIADEDLRAVGLT